ncbi:MAG: hypothetical protein WC676_01630 [Candidatus Omnitrophota bacterium]
MKHQHLFLLTAVIILGWAVAAQADMKEIKVYKEAFPGESPKCIACHTDKMPKKDDGMHELSEYGQKVIKENPQPTAETYQKVGKAPEATQ